MSTLKVINSIHPSGSTNNLVFDIAGNTTAGGTLAMSSSFLRNRIINGAMVIDQRNAGASVTPANGAYTLDRWQVTLSQASKFSIQQNAGSVTTQAGFPNYAGITSLSAYSIVSGDYFTFRQSIEGFNFADFAWGTSSAATITLSFWTRSSLTGTFGGAFSNYAGTRSYPFSYTISSANTWEQKTVTIAGDTSGTWVGASSNGSAILHFSLGTGSTYSGTAGAWASAQYFAPTGATSVVGTNGATFYITGVQLEVGSVATPFEREIYSVTLQKCQRYLPAWNSAGNNCAICAGSPYSTAAASLVFPFKVSARVPPTGITSTAAGGFSLTNSSGGYSAATGITWGGSASTESAVFNLTGASSLVAGGGTWAVGSSTSQILFTGCEL